jgi:hypothetical protein
MPTNINTVAFMNPADQANMLLEQQQQQRAQDYATALRQQSMQDIPSNGGAISWTQGMAKLAQALAANHAQRRSDAASWDMAARQQNAQAAIHDPTGTAIPQIDVTQNPYRASEAGRNLGQRLRDFVAGGPPVDPQQTALATALRNTAPAGSAPPANGDRGAAGGSARATTDDGQPVQVTSSTAGGVPAASTIPQSTAQGPAAPSPQDLAAGLRTVASRSQPATVPNPAYGSGGVDDDGRQTPTMTAPMPPSAPSMGSPPPSMPAPAPLAGMSPQQGSGTAPPAALDYGLPAHEYASAMPGSAATGAPDALLPTMPARTAYILSQTDPSAYWGAVAAAGTPIDDIKRLQQSGIDPRSPQGQALLRAGAAKAMQTPLNDDKRGYLTDPYSGQVVNYHPAMPEGAAPAFDARGNVVGANMLPGVAQARGDVARAEAIGRAAGDVQEVFDPGTGTYRAVPKTAVLSGGGAGGGAAGSIDGRLGGGRSAPAGGYQTKPGLGAEAAANATGAASAKAFQDMADGAADAGNRIYALRQMGDIAGRVVLGPGSEASTKAAAVLNSIGQAIGRPGSFNDRNVTNAAEFNKWAGQYSARAAQDLGLSGSDARMNLTVSATPNGHMTNAALRSVIPQMIGFEAARQARAAAGVRWQQSNGPATWQQFTSAWNRAYDPRLFTVQQLPAEQQRQFFRNLTPADRQALASKAAALKAMGAYQ